MPPPRIPPTLTPAAALSKPRRVGCGWGWGVDTRSPFWLWMDVLPNLGCCGALPRTGLAVVVVVVDSQAATVTGRQDMLGQFGGLSCAYARVQCWFDPPLQVQMSIRVPLVVPPP